MKEILFRGKTTGYPSKWVYGFPYIDENKQEYLIIEKGTANRYFVMPETISMFTGLFDRNGNKIFEYDVLETQKWHTRPYSKSRKSKRFTGIVVYHTYIGHNFYNKETDEFNRTCSISAAYRVRIIEEDELNTYRYSTSGEFFDCAVIGNIFDDNYLENNPKAVSILNAWKANPFDNFTRSLTDKESEICDNLLNTQSMNDTQKFDKTYVNLQDVLDIISIFYDTTLFCKRDTDQPKMLCDAIKKSNRVHSIILDKEYMKEEFKKEFSDCIADVYRQMLSGKPPVYLNLATIETTSDKFHVMHQTCSKCGETQPWKEYPKFCWNCGARFTNKECE